MKSKKLLKSYMVGWGEIHDKGITKVLLGAYFEALKPFDDETCEKAFNWATAKIRWFPKPEQLINYIEEHQRIDSPLTAWGMVYRAAEEWTDYRPDPPIRDPVARQAIKSLGGLEALANVDREKLEWFQKRFIEVYVDMLANPERVKLLQAPVVQKRLADVIECTFRPVVEVKRPGAQRNQAEDTGPNLEDKTPHAAITNTIEELRRQALILKGEDGDESEQEGLPVPLEE
jgi:hypothetical protein